MIESTEIDGYPIWYFRAVFGTQFLNEYRSGIPLKELIHNNGKNLFYSKDAISMAGGVSGVGRVKYLISLGPVEWLESTWGNYDEISNEEAYRIFGIVNMEEAVERTYTMIEYTSEFRDNQIDEILS
jgi:hypothetical protein